MEEEQKGDLKVLEKEVSIKDLRKVTGRNVKEKVVATREHALNAGM